MKVIDIERIIKAVENDQTFVIDTVLYKNIFNRLMEFVSRPLRVAEITGKHTFDNILSGIIFTELSFPASISRDTDEIIGNKNCYLHLIYYIAAIYDKLTVDGLVELMDDIKKVVIVSADYIDKLISFTLLIIKEFNKNIPDDLKLWLELYI